LALVEELNPVKELGLFEELGPLEEFGLSIQRRSRV
jgi:hypothetical protein